ncbi:MAG: hypothetical protein GY841_16940 [FCB group bacterium]|nr:hypothetical protein [FCB group bacterium]
MKAVAFLTVLIAAMWLVPVSAMGAEKSYDRGTVWSIGMIQTEANMQEQYLKDLGNVWAKIMEAAKEEGLILSYKVIVGESANPDDWDVLLLAEFKNYAALDDTEDKWDLLIEKVLGGEDKQIEASLKREQIRDSYGGKLMQEIIFK